MNNPTFNIKKRVGLIVDNPLRDLDGIVLLSLHLIKRNIEVIIVPMYQNYEVFLLKPDLVLVNYARKANKLFIDSCGKLGILVGVLDTEGGVLKDENDYFEKVSKYVNNVNLYCLWGKKQYEALKRTNSLTEKKLKITGCPRFDFLSDEWKKAIRDIDDLKDIILINTNFPIVNPKFQSVENEKKGLVTVAEFEKEYVNSLVNQTEVALKEVLKMIEKISRKFQNFSFIVRPHPFESTSIYNERFKYLSNVKICQNDVVFPWINKALVVLHHNCSTAIDSFLLGKEPVHLNWIKTPLLDQKASIDVSQHANSISELIEILEDIKNNKNFNVSDELLNKRNRIVNDWFNGNDGKNSERVSEAILELLMSYPDCAKLKNYKFNLFKYYFKNLNLKNNCRIIIQLLFGDDFYNKLKKILGKRSGEAKKISLNDVDEIVNRIKKKDRDIIVDIQMAETKKLYFKFIKFSSIVIK